MAFANNQAVKKNMSGINMVSPFATSEEYIYVVSNIFQNFSIKEKLQKAWVS